MAWTGIASILLPHGTTTHRTFRWPLDISNLITSIFENPSDKKKLHEADVIIWDEASMIPKKGLEIANRTLQDICFNNLPFGGKLLILGGDFRQILPVVKGGSKEDIIQETMKFSDLWSSFKVMKLNINMRSLNANFNKFLLKIGEGNRKLENSRRMENE